MSIGHGLYTSSEIRQKFLDFFKKKGHAIIPSAPLVPEGDVTTLFVGSGMQPLVKYLLGQTHPKGKRLVNSQKSMRAEDIDEIGDNRHTTFFEMLGNWSLGDYFKQEQLPWFFEFLTAIVGLKPEKFYVTVFGGAPEYGISQDDESVKIWQEIFTKRGIAAKAVFIGNPEKGGELGMQGGRIFYYSAKKNWWSRSGPPEKMPPREPGGPDSEVFYDFGTPHDVRFGAQCHPNCDCGRFMEVGNSVFMEYQKTERGTFEKLAQRNVDFGGGLERITAAANNDPDIFNIDVLRPLIESIRSSANTSNIRSERIIADHVRAATFLIIDGVLPSNKDRGYLLRRLIRRAMTHGYYLIRLPTGFLSKTIDTLIDSYGTVYPELDQGRSLAKSVFEKEESAFDKTYHSGIKEFEKIDAMATTVISGAHASTLATTYGFPIELTEELALQRGKKVDRGSFEEKMKEHREISRAGLEKKFGGHGLILDTGELRAGSEADLKKVTRLHTATHLLQQALRDVLGPEIQQRGSDITTERTRFDFTFGRKMTDEEKKKVEEIANQKVGEALPVSFAELPYQEAVATGALHFFKQKYPAVVKVYYIGPNLKDAYSKEFCGGPHVSNTSEIGHIKIAKEEASSAGIRRIRATIE